MDLFRLSGVFAWRPFILRQLFDEGEREEGQRDWGDEPRGGRNGRGRFTWKFSHRPLALGIRLCTYWLIVKLGMPLVLSLIKAGTQRADYHLSCLLLPTIPVAK